VKNSQKDSVQSKFAQKFHHKCLTSCAEFFKVVKLYKSSYYKTIIYSKISCRNLNCLPACIPLARETFGDDKNSFIFRKSVLLTIPFKKTSNALKYLGLLNYVLKDYETKKNIITATYLLSYLLMLL